METHAETLAVERTIAIDARPETVWELLTDPAQARRWLGTAAEFDLRPGGAYRCDVVPGNTASGTFVEIDPPRRLVYTWGWEPGETPNPVPPGSSTIEVDLEPDGEGTLLRFRHSGLPSQAAADSHAHGWDHYFARLATVTAGGDPGADPWVSGDMG